MTDDERLTIVAERIAGWSYAKISKAHGKSVPSCRRYCTQAMERGEVTAEEIGYKPLQKHRRLPDDEYNKQWLARVLRRVSKPNSGCWLWTGPKTSNHYGQFSYRGRAKILHRKFFEVVTGITPGRWQYVCHRCDVKLCINPDHLFLGDPKTNMADKCAKGRHNEQKVTHCPKGHPYDVENTYVTPRGARNCRTCTRERGRRRWTEYPEEMRERLRRQRATRRAEKRGAVA